MSKATPVAIGWSRLNIWMHWLIVLLIIVQFLDHEYMVGLWRASRRGTEAGSDVTLFGWVHIVAGILILVFAAIRLVDRFTHGRPPYPAGEPAWTLWLAKITHFLIYAILVVMPILGLVAWFGGIGPAAEVHTFLWTPLLILVGIHVLGALAQHFYFRSDVLRRIVRPAN